MLAYAIDTKTFAVGAGDGVGVGDGVPIGEGDPFGGGTVDVLPCEQPPVPTIAAAAVAHAISVRTRSRGLESDIDGIPFTKSSGRRPR